MENELTKEQIIVILTDLLVKTVGWVTKEQVAPTVDWFADLDIYGEDITVYIIQVIKHFKVNPAGEMWSHVSTIEQTAELIYSQLKAGDTYEKWLATRPKPTLLQRLFGPHY